MTPFALFSPAKVNLALHVLGRRADGYHDLDSIVAFADVGDWLTFAPSDAIVVTADGPFAADLPPSGDNIIMKAWQAVSEIASRRGYHLPPLAIHLTKNLPVASGIGGGSSNAATAMLGFLRLAGLALEDQEVQAAALKLGADVPVCLYRKPCRMRGVGERIAPLPRFEPKHAILVNPRVAVSTPAVFGRLGLGKGDAYRAAIADEQDMSVWRNDLAEPAMALAPEIREVLSALEAMPGVTRAFMSGSGATCVAFHDGESPVTLPDKGWWWAKTILGTA